MHPKKDVFLETGAFADDKRHGKQGNAVSVASSASLSQLMRCDLSISLSQYNNKKRANAQQ